MRQVDGGASLPTRIHRFEFEELPEAVPNPSLGDVYPHGFIVTTELGAEDQDNTVIKKAIGLVLVRRDVKKQETEVYTLMSTDDFIGHSHKVRKHGFFNRLLGYDTRVELAHRIAAQHVYDRILELKAEYHADPEQALPNHFDINRLTADSLQTS